MSMIRDTSAERAVLAACVADPSNLGRCTAEGLRPEDFLDRDFGRVFAALLDLDEAGQSPGDLVTLHNRIRDLNVTESMRSVSFLLGLQEDGTATRSHAVYYSRLILNASAKRSLMALACDLTQRADDPAQQSADVRNWLEAAILGLQRAETAPVLSIEDCARQFVAELSKPRGAKRAVTGLATIDRLVGAWCAGELIVLAARPGCGKTALMAQIARYNAERDAPVLLVSLEMSQAELAGRILTADAAIDGRLLRTTEATTDDLEALGVAADALNGTRLHVWAPRGRECTVGRIRAVARMHAARHGLGLLAIDYLQLIAPEDRRVPRHEQIGAMTAGIKNLAGELDCPVLLLAQLNREAEKSTAPQLSHLRESGSIEQDADIVLFINTAANDATREIIAAKHRHGQVGKVEVEWHPKQTRFADVAPKPYQAFDDWNDKGSEFA